MVADRRIQPAWVGAGPILARMKETLDAKPAHYRLSRATWEIILEAYRNKDIHPVPIKTVDQQVMGSLHRFRSGWIRARTAQVNRPNVVRTISTRTTAS